jgi:hypothetical protein
MFYGLRAQMHQLGELRVFELPQTILRIVFAYKYCIDDFGLGVEFGGHDQLDRNLKPARGQPLL